MGFSVISDLIKMKLLLTSLILVLATTQSWAMENVRQRVMYSLKVWVQGAAHCAEYATTGGEMDTAAADECRRCYAKIGDWATEEGQAKGTECLATYEPNFAEMCLETTGGADKDVEGLCMFKHMNDNLRYAKLKVYGEEFNPLGDENAQVIESIFEEGRCEHANNGN